MTPRKLECWTLKSYGWMDETNAARGWKKTMDRVNDLLYFEETLDERSLGTDKHHHSWLEIYYLCDGECNCLIDDTVYRIYAGDLMLIPPGAIHQSAYHSQKHSRLLLNCPPTLFSQEFLDFLRNNGPIYRNARIAEKSGELLRKIQQELKLDDAFSVEMASGYLRILQVSIMRAQNDYVNDLNVNVYVKKTLEYIKKNYETDLTLPGVAQICAVTPEHLSRVFRQATGMTFSKYLTEIRMQHALQRLQEEKEKSIAEIAYSCGFNDSNYFSVRFKSAYGISPLQYRMQKKEK